MHPLQAAINLKSHLCHTADFKIRRVIVNLQQDHTGEPCQIVEQ